MSAILVPGASAARRPSAPGTRPSARLRLTRRGRAVLSALAVLPLAASAFLFAINGGSAVATGEVSTVPLESVTVEAGQSLWTIAESIAPGADPRDVIASIVELNRLSSVDVVPGQLLAIPRGIQ